MSKHTLQIGNLTCLDIYSRTWDDDYMKGHELLQIRKQLDKTQTEMAAALGVALRTVSRWETQDYPLPQEIVQRLQSLHLDDDRSLIRVSSTRMLKELMSRAAAWDAAGLTSETGLGPRLRMVATDMEDVKDADTPDAP